MNTLFSGWTLRRRTHTRRASIRLCGTVLAVTGTACGWLPGALDPELLALKRALRLEIAQVNRLQSVESAEFVFKLSNHGRDTVDACIGPSRSVWFKSSGPSGVSSTFVDHPGCTKPFTLRPKGDMTWQERLDVPHLSEGKMDVEVDIEFVNPSMCGGFGCSALELRSTSYSIQ